MKLVLLPPGEFDMGSTEQEVEELVAAVKASGVDASIAEWFRNQTPRHHVRITRPFCLGKHEVTVAQFRQFVDATGHESEAEKQGKGTTAVDFSTAQWNPNTGFTWKAPGFSQGEDHPVGCLSWDDGVAFCRWLSEREKASYRLPTEAEWEYACRAGTTTRFFTGDHPRTLRGYANLPDLALRKVLAKLPTSAPWNDGFAYTSPVGRFRPNAFGLHDMYGNAAEFCADWYAPDYFQTSPVDNPPGPATGPGRVIRSSQWADPLGAYFSSYSAQRGIAPDNTPFTTFGLRVVRAVDVPRAKTHGNVATPPASAKWRTPTAPVDKRS